MKIDFRVFACPKCGSLAVGKQNCEFCGSEMETAGREIDEIIITNIENAQKIKNALCQISSSVCSTSKNRKSDKFRKLYNFKKIKLARRNLSKTMIKICPCCGHISRESFFYNNEQCCICQTPYISSKKRCTFYYFRGDTPDNEVESIQDNLREKYCMNSSFFKHMDWEKRLQIEQERLPSRLEGGACINSNGVNNVFLEGKRIQLLLIAILTYIRLYLLLIENNAGVLKTAYQAQFCDLLSDAFCILNFQYFAGQQIYIDIANFMLVDICEQVQKQI